MYCPVCLNNSLKLTSRGVVHLIINGKQMDAGRFLFSIEKDKQKILQEDLEAKIEEFFVWYSSFQNRSVIELVELCSSDVVCENGCRIPVNKKLSVIDLLINSTRLKQILLTMGGKYNIDVRLKEL